MVCLWHTMLVNNWRELKGSNYTGLLVETAILLLWHVVGGIVALARSAALMEAGLLCGTTKGFTHSLISWAGLRLQSVLKTRVQGRAGDRGTACPPHTSSRLGFISRHPPGSLFARMGAHSASLTRQLLWGWTHTKGTIPCPPRCTQLHLAFLSQEQTGPAAPAPQNTAGGRRNHFMVHSLLSPVESQEKQWLIFLEMCSEAVVVKN